MRRITKIGSVALALLVGVPAFLSLDFFGGAEAAGEAPLLHEIPVDGEVRHVVYAETPNRAGVHVYAYALQRNGHDLLQVRSKGPDTGVLHERDLGAPITDLAMAHDGTTIVAATMDGFVHLVTSLRATFDTYVRGDAHSPVTALDVTGDGAWFAAVTYHGDTWLYARERFAAGEGALFHDAAPLPLNLPGSPEPAAGILGDAVRAARTAPEFTLRPFSHVALAGAPTTAGNPRGMGIVAATAFGEIYLYDLAGLETTPHGLVLRPDVHRLGSAPCQEVDAPSGPVELPCSSAAAARLEAQLASMTPALARPLVAAVGAGLQQVLSLTAEKGLTLAQAEDPLVGFDVTRGDAPAGRQLVAVSSATGSLALLEARLGATEDPLRPLWATAEASVAGLALSRFHLAGSSQAASLVVARGSGLVEVYNVTAGATRPPRDLSFDVTMLGGSSRIALLDVARGGAAGTADAGRWLAVATDDGRVTLLSGHARSEQGTADVVWTGLGPFGTPASLDLIDNGGLLVGGPASSGGLALYAGPVRVAIDAPASVGKLKPFTARADVSAPDSKITGYAWTLLGSNGTSQVSAGTGPTFSHKFSAEGSYLLRLTVSDSFGLKTHATRLVEVGGLRPIIVVDLPTSITMGNPVTFDFAGTHDPDALNGTGIQKIDLFPFGDMKRVAVNVSTMQAVVTYEATGIFHARIVATDLDGRATQVIKIVTVSGAGFTLSPADPSGTGAKLERLVVARDAGRVLAFGGDGDARGRFSVLDGDLAPVLEEGLGTPAGGPHVVSGAISADGASFVLGRKDGSALRVPVDRPSQRVASTVADVPLDWTFLSADGRHAVFVTADGRVYGAAGNLSAVADPWSLGAGVVRAAADDRLINLVLQLADGRLVLLDGHDPRRGVLDEYTPGGTVSALEVSRDVDLFGRAWVFVGRSDGRVETVRARSGDLAPLGVAVYGSLPVWQIALGETDAKGAYRLVALTRSTNAACSSACGSIHYVRSDGPKNADGVPVPERQYALSSQPADVLVSPEGRQVVVVLGGARPSMLRFDSIWDAPVQRLTGLPTWFADASMADSGAGYVLLKNGQVAWAFAPPLAAFRVGPDNGTGPAWGARVTALTPTTFDSSLTSPGDGTPMAWSWTLGDGGVSLDEVPVHAYEWRGEYKVRLTVTSRVTYPVETTLVDRVELDLRVYDPAPVAVLSASPFNASAGAVTVQTGEWVRFDGRDSYDPRGGSLGEFRFRFGDNTGRTTLQEQVSHRYSNDGVYYATLTVYDQDGFSGVSGKIKVIVTNRAPEAAFRVTQPEGNESSGVVTYGVPVLFDGSLARDPDGYIAAWEWDFGDGTTGAGKNVEHVFAATGERTVKLRVRDDDGAWSTVLSATLRVDDGIRLRQTQDPADGGNVGLTRAVTVRGLVHDFHAYPEEGFGVQGGKVRVSVYYDGAFGDPASSPYATATLTTDDAGKVTYEVPFNGAAGVAYEPGRYRVKMIAWWEGSAHGDTEWSKGTETTFTAAS